MAARYGGGPRRGQRRRARRARRRPVLRPAQHRGRRACSARPPTTWSAGRRRSRRTPARTGCGTPRAGRQPGGRAQDLEYRIAPLPDGGHAVWFRDVTNVRRQQRRLTAIARAASSVAEAYSLPVDARGGRPGDRHDGEHRGRADHVGRGSRRRPARSSAWPGSARRRTSSRGCPRAAGEARTSASSTRSCPASRSSSLHRKPLIMADPAWAPLKEIMDRPDWDAFVSMPMSVRGRTVGVINAYYRPGEDPGPGSLAFLEAMADQAAVAIDMAALLAQTRTQAQSDERRRLARDLHDSVVQQLFSMRMQAKALHRQLDRLDAGHDGVRRAAEELAELSRRRAGRPAAAGVRAAPARPGRARPGRRDPRARREPACQDRPRDRGAGGRRRADRRRPGLPGGPVPDHVRGTAQRGQARQRDVGGGQHRRRGTGPGRPGPRRRRPRD